MNQTRSILLAAAITVGCTVAVYPSDARADASTAEHAKKAQVAYDLQNWPTAIQEYQAAYSGDPKPEYLWGLAQAQRLSGDCPSAIKSYKAYKRNDVSANQATAAELQVAKCEAEVDRKEAEAIRKANEAKSAPGAAPAPAAGPATPATPPPAAPPPKAEPTGPRPFYTDVFGDVLLVAGVAGLGVGTYFLLTGNSDMTASASLPNYRQYDSAVDSAKSKQTIGAVVLGGGALLTGCAVLRYVMISGGPKPEKTEEHVGLLVGPTGVGYSGRF